MILVDANILVYAVVEELPQHARAKEWFDDRLSSFSPVGLPWLSLMGFVRIVTNPRIFDLPTSLSDAWTIVEAWLSCPKVWIPLETPDHRSIVKHLLPFAGNGGNLVPDLQLAAIALGHGLMVCSSDEDFGRFKPVKWQNPLETGNPGATGGS